MNNFKTVYFKNSIGEIKSRLLVSWDGKADILEYLKSLKTDVKEIINIK